MNYIYDVRQNCFDVGKNDLQRILVQRPWLHEDAFVLHNVLTYPSVNSRADLASFVPSPLAYAHPCRQEFRGNDSANCELQSPSTSPTKTGLAPPLSPVELPCKYNRQVATEALIVSVLWRCPLSTKKIPNEFCHARLAYNKCFRILKTCYVNMFNTIVCILSEQLVFELYSLFFIHELLYELSSFVRYIELSWGAEEYVQIKGWGPWG